MRECPKDCACPPVPMGAGTRCRVYREELEAEVRRRSAQDGVDVWRELAKLGAPADALVACRKPWDTVALEAARRFESAPRDMIRTLLLAGPRGCGKSVAATHVLWHWGRNYQWNSAPSGGKQWRPAIWCDASEVTGQTDYGRVDPSWLQELERAKVLVLDDLGEDGTQPGLAALTSVLKARHEARRATVITSNLALPALALRYGASWYERLKVAAIAPDLRQAKSLRRRAEVRP